MLRRHTSATFIDEVHSDLVCLLLYGCLSSHYSARKFDENFIFSLMVKVLEFIAMKEGIDLPCGIASKNVSENE